MAAPVLNVRLQLEHPGREDDGIGGYRLIWRPLGILWAQMRAGTGRERQGEVGAQSVVIWRITLRGAPQGDPRRPLPGQRLRLRERLFRIEAVAESDASGRWLICHAREEAPT